MAKMTKKEMEELVLMSTERAFYEMKKAELEARKTLGTDWRSDVLFTQRAAAWYVLNQLVQKCNISMNEFCKNNEEYRWLVDATIDTVEELRVLREKEAKKS